MIRLLALIILASSGCASLVFDDFPLFERILRPRENHSLTWQKCEKEDWLGNCDKFSLEIYDITQQDTRQLFSDLGFACKIDGERYHICEYNSDIGFCKQTFERKWFLGKKKRVVLNFIGHSDVERLKQGKTRCFSTRKYNFQNI